MNCNRTPHFIRAALFRLPAIIALLVATACYTGAEITATPGQVDLGLVDEGTPAVADFVIENRGTSDVDIQGVRTN